MPRIAAMIALAALSGCAAPAAGSSAAQPLRRVPAGAPVPRSAGLQITASVTPDPMIVGAESVYAVTVLNTGDQDAENVTITDVLDPGTAVTRLPGDCSSAGQTVTCGGPGLTIGPGDSATYRIPVTTDPGLSDGTNLRNRARVSASGVPADSTQLTSQTRTLTDVEITETAPAVVRPDATITYTLTVTNRGPSQAADVTVQDETGGGRTTIAGRPAECPGGGLTLTCPLGTLAPDESREFAFTVTPDAVGVIENCATVATASREENTANNRSCAATVVEPARSPSPAPPSPAAHLSTFTPEPTPAELPTPAPSATATATASPTASPEPTPGEEAGPGPGLAPEEPGRGPEPDPDDERAVPGQAGDTLPMTGVSVWLFGLGVAVLLAVGLLVRYFSRRERAGGQGRSGSHGAV
ncbi:DUF11 domain-containing protein [Nonomuraea zeae]|nr:DUF11 domain-containing protein [Nonomuraea zeae]